VPTLSPAVAPPTEAEGAELRTSVDPLSEAVAAGAAAAVEGALKARAARAKTEIRSFMMAVVAVVAVVVELFSALILDVFRFL
jgi:t-SNARE complex subunit (syntaxin)